MLLTSALVRIDAHRGSHHSVERQAAHSCATRSHHAQAEGHLERRGFHFDCPLVQRCCGYALTWPDQPLHRLIDSKTRTAYIPDGTLPPRTKLSKTLREVHPTLFTAFIGLAKYIAKPSHATRANLACPVDFFFLQPMRTCSYRTLCQCYGTNR